MSTPDNIGAKNCAKNPDTAYGDMLERISFLDGLDPASIKRDASVKTYAVTMPSERWGFLHEAAIVGYNGRLFAAWYNNRKIELSGETPIRFSVSCDGGSSWSDPITVAADESGGILYCPPVFGICGGKLYMLLNQMVSADHIHSLDLYEYDEQANSFLIIRSAPIPFKLNTNVYTLSDGRLIMPGRAGELDGFPNTPAVLISDSGRIDGEWRLVRIQKDGMLADGTKYVHPEVSLVICGKMYAFCRNDAHSVPTVYISGDNGENWSLPLAHDIPFSASKIYSGTLSDGRNYVIGNLQPDRSKLAIFFSEPGTMKFTSGIMLQDGISEEFGFGEAWHYPSAYEYEGKLYIIYTVTVSPDNRRGAVVSIIDLQDYFGR